MAAKSENQVADKLTYRKESLELYLTQYEGYIESKNSWEIALSIFITLLITVMSSTVDWLTFKHPFEFLLVMATFVSGMVFAFLLFRTYSTERPIKKLRSKLYTSYINQPDKNALFIVKRVVNGIDQILVYRCKTWGCYFLPYTRVIEDDVESEAKKKVANILDYKDDEIEIEKLIERHNISEKYHPSENVVKEYHSYYFHLYSSSSLKGRDIQVLESFNVGKREFLWLPLEEIERDQRTIDLNQDVLDMLRNNKCDFITNVTSFS